MLRRANLSLLGLMLWGCGASNTTPFSSAGSANNLLPPQLLGRVNTLEVIEPAPGALIAGQMPTVIGARGFDLRGNLVYGPVEQGFASDVYFTGLPENTARVELEYQRASGYTLTTQQVAVDFLKDDDGVILFARPNALLGSTPRTTFEVKIVNNSDYPDDQVFVAVNGKDRNETAFYYLKFGADGMATPTLFGPVANWADYSGPLSALRKEVGDHAYSFQCPYEDLVSGRIYLSFGQKLQGLGLNSANPLDLVTPSASGNPDYQTLFEFMELSATIPPPGKGPQIYTLFVNTSVVDFFSIGLGMTMNYQEGGVAKSDAVGFVDGARQSVLNEFARPTTPSVFQRYITVVGQPTQILRVLAPSQSVALDGANSPIGHFLDGAINSSWVHYAQVVLNIPDNLPTHTFGYQYTGQLIAAAQTLNMTCTAKPAGDAQPSIGEQYQLPKPTSQIIFFCDDPVNPPPVNNTYQNSGSDAHKRLASLISSALNRGVFETYTDWGDAAKFYTRPDGQFNWYSKIMHQFAINGKVYGFGYDDVYGQDPTLAKPADDVDQLIIDIPKVPIIK